MRAFLASETRLVRMAGSVESRSERSTCSSDAQGTVPNHHPTEPPESAADALSFVVQRGEMQLRTVLLGHLGRDPGSEGRLAVLG